MSIPANSSWTVDREAQLKALWEAGELSASEIAFKMGGFKHLKDGGRNAVIGKAHRMDLPARAKRPPVDPERSSKLRKARLARAVKQKRLSIIPGRTIEISAEGRSYCSKLIDATFPESYRRVIPAAAGACVTIDREGLLECLTRLDSISTFSDCLTIDATVGDGEISITLTGLADGAETIECDTEHAGGEFFCLRTKQLRDACKTLRGDRLQIFIGGDPIRIVDLSEPEAVSVEKLCTSKNRKPASVAA